MAPLSKEDTENGRSVELVKPDDPECVVFFKPLLVLHRFVETE